MTQETGVAGVERGRGWEKTEKRKGVGSSKGVTWNIQTCLADDKQMLQKLTRS